MQRPEIAKPGVDTMTTLQPLDANDKANLNKALEALSLAEDLAKRASVAGIDVAAKLVEITDERKRLRGILQAFFPS